MGITYNTSIIKNGLVLYLDAANPKSYPGSGTIWTDLSGNGNNGTLVNGAGFNGDNKGGIAFDGVNDYVELTTDILLGSSFSLSIILKQTDARGDWVRLFGHSNDSTDRYWGVWMPSARNYILWQSYNNGGQVTTPTYNFNLNETYFIDITCFNSTRNFYLNGELFHTASSGGVIDYTGNNSKIRLGYAGFHTYYIGNYYSAKIYNRTLSQQEIQQNFEYMRGRYGL